MEVNKQFLNANNPEELGITKEKPKHPVYAVISKRSESFQTWPKDAPVSADSLTEAGFAFTGKEDAVRCFFCDGGLQFWKRGDDPWIEHATYYPKCPYVLLVKGQDFIDRVTRSLDSDGPSVSGSSNTEEDLLSSAAALSCLEMGFPKDRVLEAARTYKETHGSCNVRGEDLCEILLSMASDQGETTCDDSRQRGVRANSSTNVSDSNSNDPQYGTRNQSDEAVQEENRRLKEKHTCKICLYGVASVIFLPCGHMVSCPQCAPAFTTCPMCRVRVRGLNKALFAT